MVPYSEGLGLFFDLPLAKVKEINMLHQSGKKRKEALLQIFVSSHPCPSWELIADALQQRKYVLLAEGIRAKQMNGRLCIMSE